VEPVLVISSEASEAIRGIVAAPEIPDGAMLRIDSQPDSGLQIDVVVEPSPGDEVLDADGVELAVDPATAVLLEDKRLDAAIQHNEVTFTISDQAAANGAAPVHDTGT
jgi:Fe-S cluster assembly iron-binding protein IscA